MVKLKRKHMGKLKRNQFRELRGTKSLLATLQNHNPYLYITHVYWYPAVLHVNYTIYIPPLYKDS